MRKQNKRLLLGTLATLACGFVAIAQDDLDSLLNDLEAESKPKAAATTPVAAPEAPAVKEKPAAAPVVAEQKPAEEAPAQVQEKPAEEATVVAEEKPAPAPVVEEKPAEAAPVVAEEKPAEEVKAVVAEEKPAPAPVVAEEKPVAATPVAAEEKPAVPAPIKVAQNDELNKLMNAPAPSGMIVDTNNKDAALISELMTDQKLRRDTINQHAQYEISQGNAAFLAGDYDGAYRYFTRAEQLLSEHASFNQLRDECHAARANAKYEAAKRARDEKNYEAANALAVEAQKLGHSAAGLLIEDLKGDVVEDFKANVADIKHRRNDQDYKESRDVIRKRLRAAAQYLAVSDLDKATEEAELVLRSDPYNSQAIALRSRIQRRRDIVIGNEREAQRRAMIADVGAAWRPVYAVNSMELEGIDDKTVKTSVGDDPVRSTEQAIEARMKEMMLPAISFRPPATIIDAVDFFRQASKDYDRPEIPLEQRGFNFVLQLSNALTAAAAPAEEEKAGGDEFGAVAQEDNSGGVPQIPNISASNVSMWEALSLVCKISGFKFKVQGSIVMVMPKDMTTDELVQRSYNVVESFLDRMNDASSSLKEQQAGAGFGGGGNDAEAESGSSNSEADWKNFFAQMGVSWPANSRITYLKAVGKLRVTNTAEQLAILEQALNMLNVTPTLIEIETRFVEVAQEDMNSLGFEWLLNSDYSFNAGGKLGKVLGLKDGEFAKAPDATSPNTQGAAWQNKQSGLNYNPPVNSGKNVGLNAVNGTDYTTGMRYLSTENNHISGNGNSTNDKFMKLNAFIGNADLSMILHMLSQRSDTDLLSAPKVVTKSGQEAVIKVVTIYRYPQD